MSTKTQQQDRSEELVMLSDLLSDLGFAKGRGFNGEVWTNIDSEYMTQVYVYLSGDAGDSELNYDATTDFKLKDFFKWWEGVSLKEVNSVCGCCGR